VLPEADSPSYFGLPENIDRSSQRMSSSSVITQLKILKRADTRAAKFDREVWSAELNPILTLWKKLNTVCKVLTLDLNTSIDCHLKQFILSIILFGAVPNWCLETDVYLCMSISVSLHSVMYGGLWFLVFAKNPVECRFYSSRVCHTLHMTKST